MNEDKKKQASASHDPIVFRPDGLYTKAAIAQALGGAISADRFIARVKPPQFFKGIYRGADILACIDSAPTLDGQGAGFQAMGLNAPLPGAGGPGNGSVVKGSSCKTAPGLEPIDPNSFR